MDRIHPEGIPREDVTLTLNRPDHVKMAVKNDSCLVCKGNRVNEAGLCDVCTAQCSAEELKLVEQWMAGTLRY